MQTLVDTFGLYNECYHQKLVTMFYLSHVHAFGLCRPRDYPRHRQTSFCIELRINFERAKNNQFNGAKPFNLELIYENVIYLEQTNGFKLALKHFVTASYTMERQGQSEIGRGVLKK